MFFQPFAISVLLAILSCTVSAAAPDLISLAAKDDCDRCVENSMIKLEPACAKLTYIGNVDDFSDSKLTPQHRKCYCAMSPSSDWYQNCYLSETCSTEKMDLIAYYVSVLTTETVCPAPGSGSANATGANVPSGAVSGRAVSSTAAAGVAAAAAAFCVLL
ncbi:hypothetical protein KI688_006543 [Linnemannia hyalina]|uniref:Uncharacterized protein n=1 Tax=Linnemannia hyalina TaxID=64524 RepID=A0A9P7XJG6_9FUNG|nr:hypothetical protein KI688_006543 [Linnemannia hyalina]